MVNIALKFLVQLWAAIGEMSPYLLFGFLMAGLLSVLIAQETVERHIGRRGVASVFKASAFGIALPLCSCGAIPVGMSLRKHGASKDAAIAFLMSTPQTGVDNIMITFSMLGPLFAVIRPVAALLLGIAGGILSFLFGEKEARAVGSNGAPVKAARCMEECCAPAGGCFTDGKIARALRYGLVILPGDIGGYLLLGLVIAAVITTLIPANFFTPYLGSGLLPMLVMMAVGVPMYVCSSASVPMAAAFIHAGVSPGAALVFLMTGPATNAAAITTIWKVLGRRSIIIYLLTTALGVLGFGALLDLFFTGSGHHMPMAMPWMMPHYVNDISGVLLLAVLANALLKKKKTAGARTCSVEPDAVVQEIEFAISGMTCSHCVENVTRALAETAGVSSVNVELSPGRAVVKGTELDLSKLSSAVEQLGYRIEQASSAEAAVSRR